MSCRRRHSGTLPLLNGQTPGKAPPRTRATPPTPFGASASARPGGRPDDVLSAETGAGRAGEVTRRLRAAYGIDEPLRPEEDDPVGALVGTILSQHTSDLNSDRAYEAMRARFPSWEAVRSAPEGALADAIRSGGLANLKARRIKLCLDAIVERFGRLELSALASVDLAEARARLRELPGVGPKTAACVLLFSLGRPAIPVDTHVHRVARRLGLIGPKTSAEAAHVELERIVPPEDAYAFHVGLVRHGRRVCKAGRPLCSLCPLTDLCDAYRGVPGSAGIA